MNWSSGSLKACCLATLLSAYLAVTPSFAAGPLEALLEDFETGTTAGAQPVDSANAFAAGASNTAVTNVVDLASRRLHLSDPDGLINGAVLTLPGAIPAPGNYLITADVKVDNANQPINSFGIAAVLGAPTTAKLSDSNAGYVMNLTGAGDAALGYQTIGAAVNAPDNLTYPQDLTLYFGTDVSGNSSGPSSDGNFNGAHRSGAAAWASPADSVYIDNIRRIGPGNGGEDRHLWISVGDQYTNLASLESYLVGAKANNFNCVDILARYRADAYYVPNRTDATYANPEPFGTRVGTLHASPTNDPLQYAIDRGHELGLKVYISFSCFLVSPNSVYPTTLASDTIMWYYNNGAPRPMLSTDPGAEGLWADPAIPAVREYTKNVLMDIVSNYDIDGVVFDRVRYPQNSSGNGYGYNPQGLAAMGISGTPSPTDGVFREARRKVITDFIQECYEAVTTKKPWVVVGATPIAFGDSMNDTYNAVFQYWPAWTSRKTANKAVSFGCLDLMQPQFYRLWNSQSPFEAPAANQRLMGKAVFGDTAIVSSDHGIAPGGYMNLSPILFHPNSSDLNQSNANAQNITDARALGLNGAGLFAANRTLLDIAQIRAPGASTAGEDVLAEEVPPADYLFKSGYETIAPNSVTGFTAEPQTRGSVVLTWNPPAPAIDGDVAAKYLIYKSTETPVREVWSNLVSKTEVNGSATWYHVPVGGAGAFYYKIVPVDDYNNRGVGVEVGPYVVNGQPTAPPDIIVDNLQAAFTNSWAIGSFGTEKFGINYHNRSTAVVANGTATFSASIPVAGTYQVSEWHPSGSNRASAAHHVISNAAGSSTVDVNQKVNGGKWNVMGTYTLNAGNNTVVINNGGPTGSVVMADAIKWSYVVTPTVPPDAPTNLQATAVSTSQINLTWDDNANNETGYEIERTIHGGTTVLITNLPADTTSFSDTSLAEDTEYTYIVRAFNTGAQSDESNIVACRTLFNLPPDTIVDNTAATFVGAWSTGTFAGMFGSNYHSAFRGTGDGSRRGIFSMVAPRTAVYEVYEWHVAGTNRTSDGPHIITSNSGSQTVLVDQKLNGSKWNKIATIQLTKDQTYSVTITNQYNTGSVIIADAIKWVYVSEPPTGPLAPSDLGATVISATEISLSWNDNSDNENNFEIERTKTGGITQIIAAPAAGSISFDDTGLDADTEYTYVVRAVNETGKSSPSNSVTVRTLTLTPPDVIVDNPAATFTGPWSTNLSAPDRFQVDYRFRGKSTTPPVPVGTATYRLPARDSGVYELFEWHPAGSNRPTDAHHTVTSMVGNQLILVNQKINGGKWNSIGTFQLQGGTDCVVVIDDLFVDGVVVMADALKLVYVGELPPPPATPTSLQGTAVSQTEINLSWNDEATDETGYELVRTAPGGATTVISLSANSSSYADAGLTADTAYSYEVRAVNGAIKSPNSNSVTVNTLPNPPAAPTSLVSSVNGQGPTVINLTWVDNADNEDSYEVVANGVVVATLPADSTSYTNSDVVECTEYTHLVRAVNTGGSSESNSVIDSFDNTPPTITAPPPVAVNADAGTCAAANVGLGEPIVADNCGTPAVSSDAPASYPVGETVVTWTVTDGKGNSAIATQTVTVIDAEKPTIDAPANVTVGTDSGACSASGVDLGVPATSDNCGVQEVTNDAPGTFPKGDTVVTWTVTDIHGNTESVQQTVTVEDREAPVITCPANIAVGCNVNKLVPVSWNEPAVSDNCPGVTVECDPPSGSEFAIGTTTVNCTATDEAGNTSTCSFTVTREALGFAGFHSPIGGSVEAGNGGSYADPVRQFKLGSTVPVKMDIICDGGPVTDGIHTLKAIKYSSATEPGEAIDATPTDAATTGNQFRLTGSSWHFNMKTKSTNGFSAGKWLLIATLSDGSTHSVWVSLK